MVYPHHGAGKVLKKERKEILGERREYLTIKILHNDMTVMVPSDSAGRAGLRRVIGEEEVTRVLTVLRGDMSQMPKNWNRRFKHNRDKMKTGDVYELAEVVRNLGIRDFEKGLSTGEKQMFTRAKKILASELMYALDMEEKEAEEYLDDLLSRPTRTAPRPRAGGPSQNVSPQTAVSGTTMRLLGRHVLTGTRVRPCGGRIRAVSANVARATSVRRPRSSAARRRLE